MSKGWDNATLKKLKALTCKGLSTSEIGKRLGMSKNAIVGKLNRLGWNAKAGGAASADIPDVDSKKTAKKPAAKTAAAKKVPAKPVAPVAKKTTAKPAAKKATAHAADVKKTVAKKEVPAKKTADSKTTVAAAKNMAVHQRIIQHSLEMANLKPNQCRWPIGDPDSEDFHFCGETVFVGKPYCYEHCKQAYQFTAPPKKK
ncbi:MAG: GcrA family cell cycle regulator [Alphaproteobacteria bacterium]|nr:GcrA family cell cycle regulator [Alphaproteobacteria bacterium]